MLGPNKVLRPAGVVLGVGVDEEHLPPAIGGLGARGTQHQDAGRDARPVKEIGRQPDHRLQQVVPEDAGADLLLGTAAEEDAVGHHRRHHPPGPEHGQHVLEEHQVGLLAALGAEAVAEALGELYPLAVIVLREGRVADDAVKAHQLALVQVERVEQRVVVLDVGVGDAVEEHVHLADGPNAAVGVLAVERQVTGIAAGLLHVLAREDQHAARADARIIDAHPGLGPEQPHHQPHHVAGGVELAALLARRVGELPDQVFVGRAQHVGKLKVLVAQAMPAKVLDQLAQFKVREAGAPYLAGKVDVGEHALQRPVGLLQSGQRLVEPVAHPLVQLVADGRPAGAQRHVKVIDVVG